MSRKDAINSLFLKKPESSGPVGDKPTERVRSGAVAAMGVSLQEMANSARAASRLQEQLAVGDRVVEIDPALIDGSTVSDRLTIDVDPAFDQLVASIAENGQQLPILVRPHPERSGRFQIAYGRRRVRAAVQLGRPVAAIVKALSDRDMVIAQGRENLDRSDLSFIEKAIFAKRLEDAGYDRATIIAALAADKADLSRYISVARKVPEQLAHRIGPAPKAGRARWLALAERLEARGSEEVIQDVFTHDSFQSADSDKRFVMALSALTRRSARTAKSRQWIAPQGAKAARIERSSKSLTLTFDEKEAPNFGGYVVERLEELFNEFMAKRGGGSNN